MAHDGRMEIIAVGGNGFYTPVYLKKTAWCSSLARNRDVLLTRL